MPDRQATGQTDMSGEHFCSFISYPYKKRRRAAYLLAAELPGHGHICLVDAPAVVVLEPRQVPAVPPTQY